jgi:hypothetical protein
MQAHAGISRWRCDIGTHLGAYIKVTGTRETRDMAEGAGTPAELESNGET